MCAWSSKLRRSASASSTDPHPKTKPYEIAKLDTNIEKESKHKMSKAFDPTTTPGETPSASKSDRDPGKIKNATHMHSPGAPFFDRNRVPKSEPLGSDGEPVEVATNNPIDVSTRRNEGETTATNGHTGMTFDAEAVDRHSDDGGNPAMTNGGRAEFRGDDGSTAEPRERDRKGATDGSNSMIEAAEAAYRELMKRARQAWKSLRKR